MSKKILILLGLNLFSSFLIIASSLDSVNPDLISALELIKSRKYSNRSVKVFIGFVDLIDGAERLIDNQGTDLINDLERITEGMTSLIGASIVDLAIDASEKLEIINIINDFKKNINHLILTSAIKNNSESDPERKKLIEGLAAILYNAVYILIDPQSMKICLVNMLSGVYKVVSAILADGKIDRSDWSSLLRALASIFNLSRYLNMPLQPEHETEIDYPATAT